MAITYDAALAGDGTSASSITKSFTVGSGENRLLIAIGRTNASRTHAMTYNGVSMTQLGTTYNYSLTYYMSFWYMLNPPSGAHNLVFSVGSSTILYLSATAYAGVAQSVPDAYAETKGTDQNPRVTVTSTVNNCWFIGGANCNSITIGNGTNGKVRTSLSSQAVVLGDTNGAKAAGALDYDYHMAANDPWGIQVAAFAPYVAPSAVKRRSPSGGAAYGGVSFY